jgi:HD superfamily phosphohydrolase
VASIKDTVHGYIELNALEKRVVDTPWFQRLRHVRQNDVSSIVYPTMHTRRFEHSLGAMHVSGACMAAALRSSDPDHRRKFLDALWRDLFTGNCDEPKASWAAVQIARLHGALHDIGHPPFSHLIERSIAYALIYPGRDAPTPEKAKKWHETNGVEIIHDKILPSIAPSTDERVLLSTVAKLLSGKGLSAALKGVQSLVDAVIDTDRMDFVARDGQASGNEFGHYGLARLIDSFKIVVDLSGTDLTAVHIRPSSGYSSTTA